LLRIFILQLLRGDFCNTIGTKRQLAVTQQCGRFRSEADMRRCHGRIASGAHDPSRHSVS
jgi:hypothetical protein